VLFYSESFSPPHSAPSIQESTNPLIHLSGDSTTPAPQPILPLEFVLASPYADAVEQGLVDVINRTPGHAFKPEESSPVPRPRRSEESFSILHV